MTDLDIAEKALRVIAQSLEAYEKDELQTNLNKIADLILNAKCVYEIPQNMTPEQTEKWFLTGSIN